MTKIQYVKTVLKDLPEADQELLAKAFEFSRSWHSGQKRKSGQDFFKHPVEVSLMLSRLGLDEPTVIAGLLHDVLEDTLASEAELKKNFGPKITELVLGVTKLTSIKTEADNPDEDKNNQRMEYLRNLFLATSSDIRVLFVKLADRLHNMKTLGYLDKNSRKTIAVETLGIYAPLADLLGMGKMKTELEDLGFRHSNPREFHELKHRMRAKIQEGRQILPRFEKKLRELLNREELEYSIESRVKHLFSTARKLEKVEGDLNKIFDILALRIVAKTVPDCYKILSIINSNFQPLPYRFKDYIVSPKPNGYSSLHTTVIDEKGLSFEIQIRTEDMHREAKYGLAAHWKYSEAKATIYGTKKSSSLNEKEQRITSLLKDAATKLKEGTFEGRKSLVNKIYVFSPKNDIFELPEGATPIDFAYAVHSSIAERCIGAKVNGRIIPLDTMLENNDTVEIIVSSSAKGPTRDWLVFSMTSRAKQKIRNFLRRKDRDEFISIGKDIFNRELKMLRGLKIEQIPKERWEELLRALPYTGQDDLFAAIGDGSISPNQVIRRLFDRESISIDKPKKRTASKGETGKALLLDKGIKVSFSECCNSLNSSKIVGYITRGKGITVHEDECKNLASLDVNRLVDVYWNEEARLKKRLVKLVAKGDDSQLKEIIWKIFDVEAEIKIARPSLQDGSLELQVEVDSSVKKVRLQRELKNFKEVILLKEL